LVDCAIAGPKEGKNCREKRPLPDSDLGFSKYCGKFRQLGKIKIVVQIAESNNALQLSVCVAERNPALDSAG